MNHRWLLLACLAAVGFSWPVGAEDGSDLWLWCRMVDERQYPALFSQVTELVTVSGSGTLAAAQEELVRGITGLSLRSTPKVEAPTRSGAVLLGTPRSSS